MLILCEKYILIANVLFVRHESMEHYSILWLIDSKIQFEENETKVYPQGKALGHPGCAGKNKAKWLINPMN